MPSSPKKKMKSSNRSMPYRKQKFKANWTKDKKFKDWLAADPSDDCKAFCKYCKCSLVAHLANLVDHMKSNKHVTKVQFEKDALGCRPLPFPVKRHLSKEKKVAEIKLAAFVADHTSINTIDHLAELLPILDPDSKVFSSIKLHRTKCTMLIKNVIAPALLTELIEDVQGCFFSLIIDESTDISAMKALCIIIKYYSNKSQSLITSLYRIIEVSECNAQSLYHTITTVLKEDGIDIHYLVGIGLDGANVMVGAQNSLASLLRKDVPDLIVLKCVCHSLHLSAEKACDTLPKQLEYLVREVHNFFSHSPKRINQYNELFSVLNENNTPKKIPKLSGTRWLSRYEAIKVILDQWDELSLLFRISSQQDKNFAADQLSNIMNIPAYKAYLQFLKNILKKVCKTNQFFQSNHVDSNLLFEDLLMLYKDLLKMITVPSKLEGIADKDLLLFEFEKYCMHTSSVYFGYDFDCCAQKMHSQDLRDVRERCKNFLIVLCKEVRNRLPENLSLFEKGRLFHPQIATSQNKSQITPIATHLLHRFSKVADSVVNEWNALSNKKWENVDSTLSFWTEVDRDKDSAGNKRFENVCNLAKAFLSLPVSNAVVERAFSHFNIIKNKLRNKLAIVFAQAIMRVKYHLIVNKISCVNFKVTQPMLDLSTQKMYDHIIMETEEKTCDVHEIVSEILNAE